MTRKLRQGFTLVELLVVIGIMAVLISILLPALHSARDHAVRMKCMNNVRQLMTATIMYVNEYQQRMPEPNWLGHAPSTSTERLGWLYNELAYTGKQEDVMQGLIYPYLKTTAVYHCPLHNDYFYTTDSLTSYLMNGGVIGYGQFPSGTTLRYNKLKTDDVVFWENGEGEPGYPSETGAPFNDGSSFATEGLTHRHLTGACVGCPDGHVEYMYHSEYEREKALPAPTRFYWTYGQ
jgi:prepilin-type N-terminal cleavage/methylation domain-containing protein